MRALALLLVLGACKVEQEFTPIDAATAPRGNFGKYLSMDVSPDGLPVIGYHHVGKDHPGFAVGQFLDGGKVAWRHEEIDDDGGAYLDMAVAPDGTVWMSYRSARGALHVAHRVGKSWTTAEVDPGPDTAVYTSIAVDANGRPVVAYHDAAAGTLRRAAFDGAAWSTTTIAEGSAVDGRPADVGRFVDLVILGNTEIVAYRDAAKQSVELLEGFAGTYARTTVDDDGDVGEWPSVLVDGTTTWVAYHDVGNQDLRVARRDGGGPFSVTVVDDGEYVGADTEVFLRDGKVHVLYFDGYTNDLELAVLSDGTWSTSTVAGDGTAVGFFNEAVVLPGGTLVASYSYSDQDVFTTSLP